MMHCSRCLGLEGARTLCASCERPVIRTSSMLRTRFVQLKRSDPRDSFARTYHVSLPSQSDWALVASALSDMFRSVRSTCLDIGEFCRLSLACLLVNSLPCDGLLSAACRPAYTACSVHSF